MTTGTGPDVSSNNPHPINWAAVKGAGHTFAVVKATEGTGYTNPYFAGDVVQARAAGLVVFPYHWVSPTAGAAQGAHAVQVISSLFTRGSLVWLDFEESGVTHTVLHQTRAAIEAAGFRTGTYTYPDFWARVGDPTCRECGARPLWWADYSTNHDRPAPAPWSRCALRQTNGTSAVIPGINGPSDLSRAEVDLSTLIGGVPAPAPVPAPTPAPPKGNPAMILCTYNDTVWLVDAAGKKRLYDPTSVHVFAGAGVPVVPVSATFLNQFDTYVNISDLVNAAKGALLSAITAAQKAGGTPEQIASATVTELATKLA